jgi:hypothetical protein
MRRLTDDLAVVLLALTLLLTAQTVLRADATPSTPSSPMR